MREPDPLNPWAVDIVTISFGNWLPLLVTLIVCGAILVPAHVLLIRRQVPLGVDGQVPRQLILLALSVVAVIAVILVLPVNDSTRNQLLSVLGIVVSAIIALSSTTFVSNAMAGMMLRAVKSFRIGDFITVGEHFGRVSERGLFHTELQTERRELTTLPNLYLVNNPVTVVRSSGTIVTVELSLGYDVHYSTVEPLLLQAAEHSGLQEPFIRLTALQDHAVTYCVAGFLEDSKQLLAARSELHKQVIDALHGKGIEIVSPRFMNQRQLAADTRIHAMGNRTESRSDEAADSAPEELIFDKAEEAEQAENQRESLRREIDVLEAQRDSAKGEQRASLDSRIEELQQVLAQTAESEKKSDA